MEHSIFKSHSFQIKQISIFGIIKGKAIKGFFVFINFFIPNII